VGGGILPRKKTKTKNMKIHWSHDNNVVLVGIIGTISLQIGVCLFWDWLGKKLKQRRDRK
jgi:hypothetical protein